MDIQNLLDDYMKWLKQKTNFKDLGEYYEITTPFLDYSNDAIQFYVKLSGNQVFFTDDGYTLSTMASRGVHISLKKNKDVLHSIAHQYGMKIENGELIASATEKTFPVVKHLYIQGIMKIEDSLSPSVSKGSYFIDEIKEYFSKNEIYSTSNVSFSGKSGYQHKYDFVLQKNKTHPERLCNALNNPNKSNVTSTLFSWDDTKYTRDEDSKLIILLNDSKPEAADAAEAFRSYGVDVFKWSQRNQRNNIALLA